VATGILNLADVQCGDSIATNGVCLTVVALPGHGFVADVSLETLERTALNGIGIGTQVNLDDRQTQILTYATDIDNSQKNPVTHIVQRQIKQRTCRAAHQYRRHVNQQFIQQPCLQHGTSFV
jgi:riboflavin synthase